MADATNVEVVDLQDIDLAAVPGGTAAAPTCGGPDGYSKWVEKHALSESDAQYMAERMMLEWRVRPSFHILMTVEPGEEEALADTLDSLAVQLYKHWGLSVVSPGAAPGGWQQLANVEWLTVEGSPLDGLNAVVGQSGADWFVRLDAGVRLAPEALFSWVDHLNLNPSWRLIYVDEDTIDLSGIRCDPRFRPDFNLDLLRSTHYMGDVLPVESATLRSLSGYGGAQGATEYDLALRVLDEAGPAAIGHVAEVLVHRSVRFTRRREADTVCRHRRAALVAHLRRCGVDGAVGAGLLPGTFAVEYPLQGAPRVSIIVAARESDSRLGECAAGILERTSYPDFEVLVVGPVAGAVLPGDARVRLVAPGGATLAERCNAAARAATGRFLVFLDNEGLVGHDDWLARLVANGQRPGVGIVGGRVVDPRQRIVHAGFVLGMNGTVGSPGQGAGLDEAGYAGRLQVAQDLSAVSGACLLIERRLFDSLGGMDGDAFPDLFPDVDLCLRAAGLGHRVVWTPHVTLVSEPRRIAKDAAAVVLERDAFLGRWAARLPADPAYNRNLSLADTAVVVEAEVDATWQQPFRPRPRILAFPLDAQGSGHYRVWGPLGALDKAALAQTSLLPVHGGNARRRRVPTLAELLRAEPDTLLIQHGYFDVFLDSIKTYRRHSRTFLVFGQDDNLLDVPEKNSLKKRLIGDIERRLATALEHCDRMIVTTQPLVDVYRRFIDDIRVVPNHLDGSRWRRLTSLRRVGMRPRVGWAGAQQHLGDLDWLEEVVRPLSREVEWVFLGMCPDNLRPFVTESHAFVPFDEYPATLASLDLDLAIAPLEMHPFNECKSDLRLLEYGALGWPVIATDIYPYRGKPVTLLPNDPARWRDAIRERVHDLDALEAEGDRLRKWVLGHRMLEANLGSWFRALLSEDVAKRYGVAADMAA
jgi:glycosyltransferase involved in cell wall biosynthesis